MQPTAPISLTDLRVIFQQLPVLPLGPQNFSISVWFNTTTPGGRHAGSLQRPTNRTGVSIRPPYFIWITIGYVIFWPLYVTSTGVAHTINSAATYADGSWHHAVATCSTTTGSSLYIDGATTIFRRKA